MADKRGISGLAVTVAAVGGFLVYAGIKDVPILSGLRELAQGRLPAGRPPQPVAVQFAGGGGADADFGGGSGGSSGLESRVLTAARKYLGTPYVFGGAQPGGMDCSGLVTYVLHHDCGIDLGKWSAGCNNTHTVTGQFLITDGCKTVPRDQAQGGDLVCWPGHIGIAIDSNRMINAPHEGTVVREDQIWGAPLIRRIVKWDG